MARGGKVCEPGCTCGRHSRSGWVTKKNQVPQADPKVCIKCGVEKPLSEFTYDLRGRKYGWCRACEAVRSREGKLRGYNITENEYEQILDHQGGVCAICQVAPTNKRLAVDHLHKSGLVRGLLCWNCNQCIGRWKDDVEIIRRAVTYLEQPPAVHVIGERFGSRGRTGTKRYNKDTQRRDKNEREWN